jgi:hypothetical protein
MKQKNNEPETIELALYGTNTSKDKKIKDFFYKLYEKTDSKINLEISGLVDKDYHEALLIFITILASKETYQNKIVELGWDVYFNNDQPEEIKNLLLTKIVQKFNVTKLKLKLTDEDCKLLPDTIKILLLTHSEQLTDKGLETIANRSKNLTHLSLVDCQNITNEGLKQLPSSIKNLSLNTCYWMDYESLTIIQEKCPNLVYLSILCCKNFSLKRIQTFVKKNKKCKLEHSYDEFAVSYDGGLPRLAYHNPKFFY